MFERFRKRRKSNGNLASTLSNQATIACLPIGRPKSFFNQVFEQAEAFRVVSFSFCSSALKPALTAIIIRRSCLQVCTMPALYLATAGDVYRQKKKRRTIACFVSYTIAFELCCGCLIFNLTIVNEDFTFKPKSQKYLSIKKPYEIEGF